MGEEDEGEWRGVQVRGEREKRCGEGLIS